MIAENPRDCGETPWEFLHATEKMLNCTVSLDVCASEHNSKSPAFYTKEQNGLQRTWRCKQIKGKHMRVAWCNPPYSNVTPWIEKAIEEAIEGHTTLMLLKSDSSTKWFRLLVDYYYSTFFFLAPRIQHIAPPGVEYSSNNFASTLVVVSNYVLQGQRFRFFDWKEGRVVK